MTERVPAWMLGESRQRLADELKRARGMSGMSGRDLAQKIDISQSKVSRLESGQAVPSLPEVHAWAEAVQASDDMRELLFALTEAAHTNVQRWRSALSDRPHLQGEIEEAERKTRKISIFQPSLVPGLLQTAEYARRVFEMFEEVPYGRDELAQALAARLNRQLLLFDESRTFEFLITEGALRWRPGPPALLAAQLDRISTLSTLTNVSIGLLPYATQAVAPFSHAFSVFEPIQDEHDDFVVIEMVHGNVRMRDESDVAPYRRRWATLEGAAVYGDDARRVLHGLIGELRRSDA